MVDVPKQTFHGRIMRPGGGGSFATIKESKRIPYRYIAVQISGDNSAGASITETYNDKDRFIGTLADISASIRSLRNQHKPRLAILNQGVRGRK